MENWTIHFDPLLSGIYMAALMGASIMVIAMAILGRRNNLFLRTLALAAFMLVLMNPVLLKEKRKSVKDVAVLLVDESPSQAFGKRKENTDAMLSYLQGKLQNREDIDLRVVRNAETGKLTRETRLFGSLDQALSDVPATRRAGTIILSDGQIHDIPSNPEAIKQYGPVHLLLSGDKKEIDRQIVLLEAPPYGITGQSITARFKVEDSNGKGKQARVTINDFDKEGYSLNVKTGEEQTIDLPITNAGQNIFEISVDNLDNEITLSNNKSVFIVNGVRDRLKVLLVSGRPYTGGRTWRDMLKSDPGVDLVHFTILREPEKLDMTPQHEMSLIAFPFRELFEVKLYDFDLIIFDRYNLNRILPDYYFENIARFVKEGGGLFIVSGPEYAGKDSIASTSLASVISANPTGKIFKESFKPTINENGLKHPVTEDLENTENWGKWLRQVEIKPTKESEVLMTGAQNTPLLVLSRQGEGRVAQLASDHIWLWSRGYDNGGPSTLFLRRIVHWLMKEPELDEEALNITVADNIINVQNRNFNEQSPQVEMTKPDGSTEIINLKQTDKGLLETTIEADQLGIYGFKNSANQTRFAVVGDLNAPELASVIATAKKLDPVIKSTNGGTLWINENTAPSIRFLSGAKNYAGSNWIGLRKNNDYTLTGVQSLPLLNKWISALLLISLLSLTWWREGR